MGKTAVSKPTNRRIWRLCADARRAARSRMMSLARTIRDPFLPLLILGAAGVALFALVVLKASADVVFGVVFIGCLTAFLEIKARNDNRE
jgi:hypothetical protein